LGAGEEVEEDVDYSALEKEVDFDSDPMEECLRIFNESTSVKTENKGRLARQVRGTGHSKLGSPSGQPWQGLRKGTFVPQLSPDDSSLSNRWKLFFSTGLLTCLKFRNPR
jgi:hypothetical protein